MSISLFVLALYVFLQSGPVLGWFEATPKLTAVIGIVFVIIVVVEAILVSTNRMPKLFRRDN